MLELAVRVVVSLLVVLGLFWACARVGSRRLGGTDRALLRVRGRQALSRGSSMAVVEVAGRVLVVGVSDSGVRLLTELDPEELPEQQAPTPAAPVRRRRTARAKAAAAAPVAPVAPVALVETRTDTAIATVADLEPATDVAPALAALAADPASRFVPYFPHVVERAAATVVDPVEDTDLDEGPAADADCAVDLDEDADDTVEGTDGLEDADEALENWGLDIFTAPEPRSDVREPAAVAAAARAAQAASTTLTGPARPSGAPVAGGALAGSVLDAGTWRQAWAAATRRHQLPPDVGETA